jgi:hypothetical protein
MKSKGLTLVVIAVLGSLSVSVSFSQQDSAAQNPKRLVLTDGSELIGSIIAEDSASISFKTLSGISITIPKKQVKTVDALSGEIDRGEYIRPDPNHTRLLFSPTARPLRSGQGYFSAYQIFFPLLAVGVGDFLTLAGGISLFPGAESQLFYLAPKITPLNTRTVSLAGGVLYMNATSSSFDGVGIIYGVTTIGGRNASLTTGLGWGFHGEDTADRPALMIGGDIRASNSVKLITENWIFPDSDIHLISFGIRFFGENLSADLGFVYPAGSGISGFPFLPWLGFAYNFGAVK